MKVMVIVKATKNGESGIMPNEQLLSEMGKYNEEIVKAGILLAGDGLHPSVKGKRIEFSGSKRSAVDGPFPATKELVTPASNQSPAAASDRTGEGTIPCPV